MTWTRKKKWAKWWIGLGLGAILTAAIVGQMVATTPKVEAYVYAQPPIPHSIEGQSDCLACHSSGGVKAVPASHTEFPNQLCTSCHKPAAQKPAPTPTPTATAPPAGVPPTQEPQAMPTSTALAPLTEATPESTPTPEATPTPASTPVLLGGSESLCLACHKNSGLSMSFRNGEPLSLYVDYSAFKSSVHGASLSCTNCHIDRTSYPHPSLDATGKREYELISSRICLKCHAAVSRSPNEAITDRFHAKVQRIDRERAPTCIDCHSPNGNGHDIAPVEVARESMYQRCARCHKDANESFALAITGHEDPSSASSPIEFFMDRFFFILTTVVLAFGIVHVELDLLRWFANRRKDGR